MKRNLLTNVGAGLLLCAAGVMTAAANTIITFSVDMSQQIANGTFNPPAPAGTGTDSVYVFGTFNGYNGNPGLQLFQMGDSTVYTNSYNDTGDANGTVVDYRFYINNTGNLETTACWDNRAAELPATSGASLVLPTPYYGDVGPGSVINVTFQVDMSEEIKLGHFVPGTDQVDIRGSFNGWGNSGAYLTNDPRIVVTNSGIVESNVYTLTVPITSGAEISGTPATNAMMEWKAVEDPAGSWESPGPADADANDNRFWCNNTNQVLPIVNFNDVPLTPPANVTLNVDMSGPIAYDPNMVPNSVTIWGTFNSWANGVQMTNNPAAANPNVYSATIGMSEGTALIYQVRYTNTAVLASSVSGGYPWVYDYANDEVYNNNARRIITLPITSSPLNTNVPVFYFLDLGPNDYLRAPTPVLFSVDMTDAVATNGYAFNPSTDAVYVNGEFANYGGYPEFWYPWSVGVFGIAAPNDPEYQMIRSGSSLIYTNIIVLPAGTPVGVNYNYGIDAGSATGGPAQDEATNSHFRVIRSTAANPYVLPVDTFTNQPYQEPLFSVGNIGGMGNNAGGDLTVGAPVAGKVPVSWLGRPGAHLQVSVKLNNASWQDLITTDGTTWSAGYNSVNGLVSTTNWPASGNAYFRLVLPNAP